MIKPISPKEITQELPEFVIIGANNCINKHWSELNRKSHFTQDELIAEILAVAPDGITRRTLFDNNWLDIEPAYRREGWIVDYDKPGYCETYAANFTFTAK